MPLPQGALVQAERGPGGMPPCKRCGAARLHSRDELLNMEDSTLLKMEDDLSKEVEDLENDLDDMKKKQGDELGKLDKRLNVMNAAYKKFGKDAVARTTKFTNMKAKASKDLDSALEGTKTTHAEITKLYATMDKLRAFVNPYVDKLISGKGWPKGCKCQKAKALLQHLQASLHLASLDLSDAAGARPKEALLRRSAKAFPQEKYKLVRAVQQVEEKRAKLMQEKTAGISGFGQQQRIRLDRIDTAKIKANLKASTESKYEESDVSLEGTLKSQIEAADSYRDSAKAQLARLQKNEEASVKVFEDFKAELKKCKCL